MKILLKMGVVAVGYVVAFLIAGTVVAVRVANTSGPEALASSGMYAFGDTVVFAAVFSVGSLLPTCAALLFLRPYRRFWLVLSSVALAVAASGVAGALLFAVGRHETATSLAMWASASVLRMLFSPPRRCRSASGRIASRSCRGSFLS